MKNRMWFKLFRMFRRRNE